MKIEGQYSTFWDAVSCNDVQQASELLDNDPTLASRDLRPPEEQDAHTHAFPLVQASTEGHLAMVQLLLKHGADVNAKSPAEDQREFGMPLHFAVVNGHYEVANRLLDHGASVYSYPYCDKSTTQRLYHAAIEAGAPASIIRHGMTKYLGPVDTAKYGALEVDDDAPEVVTLLVRFLSLGADPSLSSIVRAEQNDLIEELLRTCPTAAGSRHDWPAGTVFENTLSAASWLGYPKVVRMCMDICADLYDAEIAQHAMQRAIISHNRDGTWQEYRELIHVQLSYLEQRDELEALRAAGDFQPLFLLAENYCWPRNYGHKAEVSTPEGMIAIAKLFLDHGFDDLDYRHPESNLTPLAMAKQRSEHPCMDEFTHFLLANGATG